MITTIHVERAKSRISQAELAESVQVSRQTIHSIETGKKIPSVKLAINIASFLKVGVEDIFKIANENIKIEKQKK